MNWYKKAQMSRPGLDWDKVALELRKELGREPTPNEIQQKLYEKYWEATTVPQQGEQLVLFQSMDWNKKAQDMEVAKDHLEKELGLGKYLPPSMTNEDRENWKKNRKPREPEHSMDMGDYEGEDDGW